MRIRFPVTVSILSVLAVAVLLVVVSGTGSVQAQGAATATPKPRPGVITSNNSAASFTLIYNRTIPGGGVLVTDLHINNTATVSFDTWVNLRQYCKNVALYRETEAGDLIAHPFVCNGNVLTFAGMGNDNTADYFIAVFFSAKAAKAAPTDVILNWETQALGQHYTP